MVLFVEVIGNDRQYQANVQTDKWQIYINKTHKVWLQMMGRCNICVNKTQDRITLCNFSDSPDSNQNHNCYRFASNNAPMVNWLRRHSFSWGKTIYNVCHWYIMAYTKLTFPRGSLTQSNWILDNKMTVRHYLNYPLLCFMLDVKWDCLSRMLCPSTDSCTSVSKGFWHRLDLDVIKCRLTTMGIHL